MKLLRCLYGLKQSPHEWNADLDNYLKSLGFKPCDSEPCIYVRVHEGNLQYILVYVDDLLLATKTVAEMKDLKAVIDKKYPLQDRGELNLFLNMKFTRDRNKREISLSQPAKIAKVLSDSRYDAEDLAIIQRKSSLPADPNIVLSANTTGETIDKPYKNILGQVLFIAMTCRPDISTAVSNCGKYAANPNMEHWKALMKIVSYLGATKDFVLTLGGKYKEAKITAYADADWAGDRDTRKSRSGYAIFLSNSLCMWSSKMQVSTALSSTEAEYISLSLAARDIIWCRHLLADMKFTQEEATVVYEDNDSCRKVAQTLKQLPGTKHIEIRHHFIREKVHTKEIALERKGTQDMIADIFTKALPSISFTRHRMNLRVQSFRGSVDKSRKRVRLEIPEPRRSRVKGTVSRRVLSHM